MKSDWLITSSLDFSIEALSAINILSIDYKLKAQHIDNPIPSNEVEKSRKKLLSFLKEIQVITIQQNNEPDALVLGEEPHVEQLAAQIIQNQKGGNVSTFSIEKLVVLLEDDNSSDMELVIEYLDNLSTLVEQQALSDFDWVWGNI